MFALLNAKDMYEENIHDLENYSSKIDLGIKIINTNYNLLEILREYNIVDWNAKSCVLCVKIYHNTQFFTC